MRKLIALPFMVFVIFLSCSSKTIEHKQDDIIVYIEQGKDWKHDFPLFGGIISKKNTPQIAVWIEDTCGKYISTIYVTKRIATQSWIMAKGNRRKEALPHWCHSRGVKYKDGLYSPTKDEPIPDAITGATPKGSFSINVTDKSLPDKFIVKVEVNHSTDFNDNYPKYAKKGEINYSGGEEGSGQPALVYSALVDTLSSVKVFEAQLLGHSSPDGSSGELYKDMSGITTALNIIDRIIVEVK